MNRPDDKCLLIIILLTLNSLLWPSFWFKVTRLIYSSIITACFPVPYEVVNCHITDAAVCLCHLPRFLNSSVPKLTRKTSGCGPDEPPQTLWSYVFKLTLLIIHVGFTSAVWFSVWCSWRLVRPRWGTWRTPCLGSGTPPVGCWETKTEKWRRWGTRCSSS